MFLCLEAPLSAALCAHVRGLGVCACRPGGSRPCSLCFCDPRAIRAYVCTHPPPARSPFVWFLQRRRLHPRLRHPLPLLPLPQSRRNRRESSRRLCVHRRVRCLCLTLHRLRLHTHTHTCSCWLPHVPAFVCFAPPRVSPPCVVCTVSWQPVIHICSLFSDSPSSSPSPASEDGEGLELPVDHSVTASSFRASIAVATSAFLRAVRPLIGDAQLVCTPAAIVLSCTCMPYVVILLYRCVALSSFTGPFSVLRPISISVVSILFIACICIPSRRWFCAWCWGSQPVVVVALAPALFTSERWCATFLRVA